MAKDIITRLKLDASQHNQGLSKAKQSLEKYAQGAYSTDSVVKGLIGTFGKYVGAIGLATTAMNTLKDAFMRSENNIDEWGRTTEAAKASYNTFLDTLTTGNWSTFFDNLNTAIQGARDLYDSLDRLGSIKTNNAAAIAIQQQRIAALRLAKQNETDKAKIAEIDKQIKTASAELARLQNQGISAGKQAGNNTAAAAIQQRYNTNIGSNGSQMSNAQAAMIAQEMIKGGQGAFDKYAKQFAALQAKGTTTTQRFQSDGHGGGSYYTQQTFDIGLLTKEEQKQYALAKAITEGEADIANGINIYAQAVNEGAAAAREEFKAGRYANSGGKGGSTSTTKSDPILPEGSIAELTKQIKDYREQQNLATNNNDWQTLQTNIDATQAKIDEIVGKVKEIKPDPTALSADWFKSMQIDTSGMAMGTQQFFDAQQINADWQMLQDSLDGTPLTIGVDITDEEWTDFLTRINEQLAELGIDPITIPINTQTIEDAGKVALTAEQHAQGAAKAFSAVGNALSQIDDPGAKVMGLVAEAIGTIAATFAASLKGTFTPWDWIAAAAAGTATMISTIAAIKSATAGAYADGGVIGGNSYVGDRLYARVNSGETILNQDQAQRALDMMEPQTVYGGGGGNSIITGEQLVTVINNYGRRTGRGEILR